MESLNFKTKNFSVVCQSLNNCTSLTSKESLGLTFVRSTSAFYFHNGSIKITPENILRRERNSNGELLGWLIEPTSINLLKFSSDLGCKIWKKNFSVIEDCAVGTPICNGRAYFLRETGAQISEHCIHQDAFCFNHRDFTASTFVKFSHERSILLSVLDFMDPRTKMYAVFDSSGLISTFCSGDFFDINAGFIIYPEGWFRCYSSFSSKNAKTHLKFKINTRDTNSVNYVGDETSGFYLFAPQLEPLSYVSSFIPSEKYQVVRACDMFTAQFFDDKTLCCIKMSAFAAIGRPSLGYTQTLFQIDDGTTDNKLFIFRDHRNIIKCVLFSNKVLQFDVDLASLADKDQILINLDFTKDGLLFNVNKTTKLLALTNFAQNYKYFRIGNDQSSINQWGGHIRECLLFFSDNNSFELT